MQSDEKTEHINKTLKPIDYVLIAVAVGLVLFIAAYLYYPASTSPTKTSIATPVYKSTTVPVSTPTPITAPTSASPPATPPTPSATPTPSAPSMAELETTFRFAAMNGDVKLLQSLMAKGIKVDAKDSSGATALYLAVEAGELAAVKFLLNNNAYPDAQLNGGGYTALLRAAHQKNPQFARLLLEAGASPYKRTSLSLTSPLMEAVESDNLAVIALLLKHDANIQAKDMLGEDVLDQIRKREMEGEDNPKLRRMASMIAAEARRQGIRLYR